MNAAVIHTLGEPPRFEQFSEPVPIENEVLVHVLAAGLHPVVKALASGSHYGSTAGVPFIPGVDGVGRLDDGSRVYFGMVRRPYGTMAERAVAPRSMCWPLPAGLEDAIAAAVANPGMSAWLALSWRAKFVSGESVLVLGATGVAGQLAVQIAKRFGARRVIAAGRNERVFEKLQSLGADATIRLDQPKPDLIEAFAREARDHGVDVVIDYLWGDPTEALIQAITRKGLSHVARPVRLVEVGDSAGKAINLPAAVLRSSGLEIYGSGAGTVPIDEVIKRIPEFFDLAAKAEFRIDVEKAPLERVEEMWQREFHGRRLVFVP
ncbi:MAG: zinc-binding alcohol dehydrogenase family protein [Bryobacteraceae bacterium]